MTEVRTLTIGKPQGDPSLYSPRTAVRCILENPSTRQICIIHVSKDNFYKLPGGGVEPEDNGDHSTAALRECLEECGCEVEVHKPVARTLEWRGTLKQTSYAYRCTVVRDTGNVALTEDEVAEGLRHEWCDAEEALGKVEGARPTGEMGRFIRERDTFLLKCYLGKV